MKNLILASLITVFLTGCASLGRKIDVTKFEDVSICKTTRAELISMVGAPWSEGKKPDYTMLNWEYGYADLVTDEVHQVVIALLNSQKIIVDYVVNPVGEYKLTDKCEG
jgi:PBP1b-binding outer membrane lipoprotein LpoB